LDFDRTKVLRRHASVPPTTARTTVRLNPVQPIGFVRNRVDRGKHAGRATIELFDEFVPGLLGLDQCSHAVVLFQLQKARFDPSTDLLYRPHADRRMRPAGIFAQRCPHRPNQLGVTTVAVLAVDGKRIVVSGLDAWKGTPVLDIKPYLPWFDRPKGKVRVPKWFR
jgi:tRNA (adenine37-N6)-methyltransferase